ncbi:MAG: bifunctional adenosylcobinamide kinase/adenosylcobinamide-phosphate guanylyltransferase [Lachnospiraceae bacterium]|nr:bifunctional adenosylcobinamide kinase/adenosylcobinamide-phosphate guanylyltransferase [Lachnospiraceae bacterium]
MILVIGPRFSYKKKFIMEKLGMSEEEWSSECVSEAQELVRDSMTDARFLELVLELSKKKAVTVSETGSGVVPMDKEERLFRERAGKLSLMLAEEAEEVFRVVCGLPQKLKGQENI